MAAIPVRLNYTLQMKAQNVTLAFRHFYDVIPDLANGLQSDSGGQGQRPLV